MRGYKVALFFLIVLAPLVSNAESPVLVYRPGDANFETKGKVVRTKSPPGKLISAVKKSNEISVEVWAKTDSLNQKGPARIVTLSRNTSERNFTLGQDGSVWDFRLRTTGTSSNGLPSVASPKNAVKQKMSHVVFTREKSGKARLYIDGKKVVEKQVKGDFSNWNNSYHLGIGNELSGDRAWKGTLARVAIYDKALPERTVSELYKQGPASNAKPAQPEHPKLSSNEKLFHDHIAPMLANHCLECHDSATRKGDLDLSIADDVDPEELFASVEEDEMPKKRPPLSDKEKQLLQQWVDGGAKWALKEKIDPANYIYHGRNSESILRRLTLDEYIATVKSTLGVSIEKEAREYLPRELRADGFRNTSYNLTVDFHHIEAYAKLAQIIVGKLDVPEFAKQFSNRRNVNDKDMRSFIGSLGDWVLRGPLSGEEINIYRGITTTVVSAGGGFDEAVAHVLEAMLQSPGFIYQVEEDDGSLSGEELACRLSYMIWGTSPDRELWQKAKNGELYDRGECAAQVQRMLSDPKAKQRALSFASQWLNLDRLQNMKPNADHFPKWSGELAGDMKDETLAFFEDVVLERKQPLISLINEQSTWLTPKLADHYGIKYSGDGKLVKHDLNTYPERGGLLTHGSILTIGGDEASMVTRGLFVLNDILRSVVKDPPPCVDTTPVASKPGLTQRSVAEERIANKSCGGCHSKFEPLAFGLEKFDGLGAFHQKDHHGNQLRDDGEILFPGDAEPVAYENSAQLMDLLAKSDRVSETIAWKLTQFSIGRPLRSDDLAVMRQIIKQSGGTGATWNSLIEAIAMSDLIQSKSIKE